MKKEMEIDKCSFNSQKFSSAIDLLRIPLLICVLFIHNNLNTIVIQGNEYNFEKPLWYSNSIIFLSQIISEIAVPLFYFISGYLFFINVKDFTSSVYNGKIKKKVHSLLIPYLMWNFIAFVLYSMKRFIFPQLFPSFTLGDYNWSRFFSSFWAFQWHTTTDRLPIDTPMWFIRDLMIVVILSPCIYWLVRYLKIWVCVLFGVCFIFNLWPKFTGLSIVSIFYFTLGAYFSIGKYPVIKRNVSVFMILALYLISTFSELYWELYYRINVLHNVNILLGVFACLYMGYYLVDKKNIIVPKSLLGSGLVILGLHNLFMADIVKIVCRFLSPQNPVFIFIFLYIGVVFITASICIIVYYVMKKCCPKISAILTGGR